MSQILHACIAAMAGLLGKAGASQDVGTPQGPGVFTLGSNSFPKSILPRKPPSKCMDVCCWKSCSAVVSQPAVAGASSSWEGQLRVTVM